ncbi:hypothetical protein, partial [Acinetobacter bereziniae]|uniref:hypothetical protein n=1 Tax=Acinetobacter bereziniae TaxID=106648 RepID=UPI001C65E494
MAEVPPAMVPSVIVISDSPSGDRGKGVATDQGAGAVEQPGASAAGRTGPQLGEGSSTVATTGLNPNDFGGPPILWWAPGASEPIFSLNDEEEMRLRNVFREYSQAMMKSLQMATEILSEDVARVSEVRTPGACPEWLNN